MGKFCLIFIGSIIIGAMTALIVSFIQKRQAAYTYDVKKADQLINPKKA